jgi:archaellum component FlaC
MGITIAALVFGFLPTQSMAGVVQETSDTQNQPEQGAPQPFFEEEDQMQQEEYVDPGEIKRVLSELNDLKRQIKQVLKKAQKVATFASEVNELNSLLSEVDGLSNTIRNASPGDQRDALQEFYNAQVWDTLNSIRTKIELPKELKFIEKDLKRLEKLLASKKFSIEKVDLAVVRAAIEEIKNAVGEARNEFNQGNFEEAREALEVIYEGSHPGEIYGVLQQLREMNKRLKRLKTEVKDIFHEALEPVYEAIQSVDFREANMMLQDIWNDLWRLLDKVKGKSRVNEDMRQNLQNLEERLQQKQQQIQDEQSNPEPQGYQPYQASILDAVSNWLTSVFDR